MTSKLPTHTAWLVWLSLIACGPEPRPPGAHVVQPPPEPVPSQPSQTSLNTPVAAPSPQPDGCCVASSECAQGQQCCSDPYGMENTECTAACQATPCRTAEACTTGSCPTGQICNVFANCAKAAVEVACGSVTCGGEKPYCVWNGAAKTGECQPVASERPAYRCDGDSDCLAGDRCWLGMLGSFCCRGESCFDHAATSKYVACKTAKDCPQLDGLDFECIRDDELLPAFGGRRCHPVYK